MSIQPIVVGTAGHIDHGKSTLVKALTGIDPDRLKEEQERGMTIDLGFARLTLPDGRTVGIIDVPGHERFVKNMVAGATGIDLVILVVAADDGVMPQTREHLAIMTLLGVKRGFVALTKIDAVEPALVELATDDVKSTVRGTFLENAPVIPVSSITGRGLDLLRATLHALAAATQPRSSEGLFRMPIQRVFSAHGHGTVLTGVPVSGTVRVGEMLEVLPLGVRGKVRGLQAYHERAELARAGHSTAINLSDIDHRSVRRGDVVAAPGAFRAVRMLGARVEALATLARPIADRTRVRFHTGTSEVQGELVLLERAALAPGESALAQIRLDDSVVCAPGDRFIVRLASPTITLGGGVVLEESKHRLKRFKGFVVDELTRQERGLGSPKELCEVVLARAPLVLVSADVIALEIKRSKDEARRLLDELVQEKHAVVPANGRWIHVERWAVARERLNAVLTAWFDAHAHREVIDVRDLRRETALDDELLDALLADEERAGRLRSEPGGFVRRAGAPRDLDEATRAAYASVLAELAASRFQPPSASELAARMKLAPARATALLQLAVDRGAAVRIAADFLLAREHYEAAREAIIANCKRAGSLDIPSLRDTLGTTRKYLIPLLEHFDSQGVTLRQGANRVLRRR
ncbi:MAG: selenocysteine-specific translation elongation factor [Planctomycetota bacterium]